MKLLNINGNGVFGTIEAPDLKLYTIKELKNCTVPPLCVLYQHQLFVLYSLQNNIAYYTGILRLISRYREVQGSTDNFYFIYNFKTHKITNHYTLEDKRLGNSPTAVNTGGGSSA